MESIKNKKAIADRVQLQRINGTGYPIPSVVEFNIWGNCNRRCPHCPVSTKFYHPVNAGMEFTLYAKIIFELMHLQFHGMILFSAFSEPLLNPKIDQFIKLTKTFLSCQVEISTNGDAIRRNPSILEPMFSEGLDKIHISVYSNYYGVNGGFDELIDKYPGKVVPRRRYFLENAGDMGMIVTNRAGVFESSKTLPLHQQCYYPFYQLTVDLDGDVLLCPHDWQKQYVSGNLKNETIWGIWTGLHMETVRSLLADKKRDFLPCSACDADGRIMGEGHYNAWDGR